MECRRLLPGSLTATGAIVDYKGVSQAKGPCWVPRHLARTRQCSIGRGVLAFDKGWRAVSPTDDQYPGIPPSNDLFCVVRIER